MVTQRSHNGLDHTISTVVKHSDMEKFFLTHTVYDAMYLGELFAHY